MKVKNTARTGIAVLQMIARVISRSYRVTVVNGTPRTDGKTIWLPMIDPADLKGPGTAAEKARVIHGYLDHEAGHVLHTSMDEYRQAIHDRKCGAIPCADLVAFCILLGILEDIRIEGLMARRYPGSRANLADTARHAFHTDDAPTAACTGWDIVLNRLVRDLRREILHQDCQVSKSAQDASETVLCSRYDEVYQLAARQFDTLTAVIAGTDEVLAKIKEIAACSQASQKTGSVGSDRSPEGDDSSEGDGSLEGDDSPEGDRPLEGGDPSAGDCSPEIDDRRERAGSQTWDLSRCNDSGQHDLAKIIQDRMHSKNDTDESKLVLQESAMPVDLSSLHSTIAATSTRMQALLEKRTECRAEPSLAGQLNRRVLHRPSVGNPYVFTRNTGEDLGINANVVILLDRSGSMTGVSAVMQAQSGYIVTQTLETMGVAVSVLAFGDTDGTTLVKDWWEPTPARRFCPLAEGGTPMDKALEWGRAFLNAPPSEEGKRIAIVITDGLPDDINAARQRAQEIIQDGGHCLFLGILVPREKFLETFDGFPAEVITKLEDLPNALGRIAINAITARAA